MSLPPSAPRHCQQKAEGSVFPECGFHYHPAAPVRIPRMPGGNGYLFFLLQSSTAMPRPSPLEQPVISQVFIS